jgi:hypothetical protein
MQLSTCDIGLFCFQAAEYMQQLPPSKLPISGSDGALFRRQQLEIQVPLHDLDASKCHGLTPDEIQGLALRELGNMKCSMVQLTVLHQN